MTKESKGKIDRALRNIWLIILIGGVFFNAWINFQIKTNDLEHLQKSVTRIEGMMEKVRDQVVSVSNRVACIEGQLQ
jgi:hypothetical protein